jgi:hypothetical protein
MPFTCPTIDSAAMEILEVKSAVIIKTRFFNFFIMLLYIIINHLILNLKKYQA